MSATRKYHPPSPTTRPIATTRPSAVRAWHHDQLPASAPAPCSALFGVSPDSRRSRRYSPSGGAAGTSTYGSAANGSAGTAASVTPAILPAAGDQRARGTTAAHPRETHPGEAQPTEVRQGGAGREPAEVAQ